MNLSVIKNAVTSKVARQALLAQKNSPHILFAAGAVGVVATVVMASRATLKLEDVFDEHEEKKAMAERVVLRGLEDYTQDDYKKDMVILHTKLVLEISKLYAPAVVLGVGSICALGGSHMILTKRNASLMAAYSALEKGFKQYRQRVIDDVGVEKDREYRFGKVEKEVLSETKKGEPKVSVVKKADQPNNGSSIYARVFGTGNPNFQPTHSHNEFFIRMVQIWANDRLKSKGHVFLNEVYTELGMEHTTEGAVTGWRWGTEDGDNFVDFCIWNPKDPGHIDDFFVNDADGHILIDFNVDGVIYDKI
jgi:hypothetical protein